MNIEDVTNGDTREGLTAVRNELALRLAEVKRADAVAPIAKTLVEVILRIDSMPNDAEGSVTDDLADELAARRTARPAPTVGVEEAAGS